MMYSQPTFVYNIIYICPSCSGPLGGPPGFKMASSGYAACMAVLNFFLMGRLAK